MKPVLVFASLILAVAAVVLAVFAFVGRAGAPDLAKTIDELESRLTAAEAQAREAQERSVQVAQAPQELEKEIVSIRGEIIELSTRHEKLDNQVRESEAKRNAQIRRLEKKIAQAPLAGGGEVIRREQIEELIEEKMGETQEPLGKEPQLSAVAARLDLSEMEQKTLEDILRKKKSQMKTVLETPRADGSSILSDLGDEIVTVLASGEGEQGLQKIFPRFFQRVVSETVPGTDKTYFACMVKMQEETRKAFRESLSKKQFRAFQALGVENPMDIKIPNGPIDLYIQQRMQAAGVTPPGPPGK